MSQPSDLAQQLAAIQALQGQQQSPPVPQQGPAQLVPAQGAPPFVPQPYAGTGFVPQQAPQLPGVPFNPYGGQAPPPVQLQQLAPPQVPAPQQLQPGQIPGVAQLVAQYAQAGIQVSPEQAAAMLAQQAPQQPPAATPQQLEQQIQALQAQQKAQTDAQRAAEVQQLIAGGDYKTLYEQEKARADQTAEQSKTALAQAYASTALANAKAINPDIAMKSLDLSKVTDATTAAREVYALQQGAGFLFQPAVTQLPQAGSPLQLPAGQQPQQQPGAPAQQGQQPAPTQAWGSFPTGAPSPGVPFPVGAVPQGQGQVVKSPVDTMAEGYGENAAAAGAPQGQPAR